MVKTMLSRQILALSESSAIKAVKRKRGPTVTISRAEGSGKSAWARPGHSDRVRRSERQLKKISKVKTFCKYNSKSGVEMKSGDNLKKEEPKNEDYLTNKVGSKYKDTILKRKPKYEE